MLPALLVGSLVVAGLTAAFLGWLRLPRHVSCPACGASTSPLAPEGAERLLGRWVWRRWCGACRWEGVARRGPDLSRGPVDHDSGFRWGEERTGPDLGFRWGRSGPRAHPSGFRWAPPDAPGDDGKGSPGTPARFRRGERPPRARRERPPADE